MNDETINKNTAQEKPPPLNSHTLMIPPPQQLVTQKPNEQTPLSAKKQAESTQEEAAPKFISHNVNAPIKLPNCKITGTDYRVSLKQYIAESVNLEEIENVNVDILPRAFPIFWDLDKHEIFCSPEQAGEFKIHFIGDLPGKGEKHSFWFKLTVEEAPKTQNTPSEEESRDDSAASKTISHKKTLPNCKITGIDYRVSLEQYISEFVDLEEIKNITEPKIDAPAEFPIHWNPDKYEILCHPNQAGDFLIHLRVITTAGEKHSFAFKLIVNPDPKTLWKNIPSRQDGVYAKADCDKLFLPCGDDLSIAAAGQRGRSHAQEGRPRDDDFIAHWDAETGCAILAVADGAGSARFSRRGSLLAVQTALEKVKAALAPEFWTDMIPYIKKCVEDRDVQARKNIQVSLYKVLVQAAWEAKTRIKEEALEHEENFFKDYKIREKFSARDYATTLILTIVKKLDAGWFVATFWIGDGGMGVYSPEKVIVQGVPDGGEYGGQTRFLTEDSAEVWPQGEHAANKIIERRIYFDVVDSFDAVILMTDGVTDPKFETDNNLNSLAKWSEFWADLKKEVPFEKRDDSVADALLKWMDFWSPGNHDDRTMIVLY